MPHNERHGCVLKLHRADGFGEVSTAQAEPKAFEKTGLRPIGTIIAVNYLALGVAANFNELPAGSERARRQRCSERTASANSPQQHGGARNRADRVSLSLTKAQVTNLLAAVRHAQQKGLPLNRMITVHWEAAGVPLNAMARATGRLTDLLSKTLARHGSCTAWVWVHEGGDNKGGHCHLLVHVPSTLVALVARRQRSWLKRITGKSYRPRVILSRPIGGLLGLEIGNPELYAANLTAAVGYLTKGIEAEAAAACNILKLEPGGSVIGKRCGTSQNIGRKARKEDHG